MASINFDAAHYETQALPSALPEPSATVSTAPDSELTADQQAYLGIFSEFLNRTLETPAQVLLHIKMLHDQRAAQLQQQRIEEAKTKRYDPVTRAAAIQARAAHALVVNEANAAWRNAVDKRKRVLAEIDAEIRLLHTEFKRLKDMPV